MAVRVEEVAKANVRSLGSATVDQMIRAADSIVANIAEGYGRGVSRDGLRFFTFARSSADELEAHLRLAGMKRRLPQELATDLVGNTRRVGFLVFRYAESVERRRK